MKISSSYLLTFLCFLFTSNVLCSPAETSTAAAALASDASATATTTTDEKTKAQPVKVKRTKKKSTKDWDKISEGDLEKDWEKGDEEFELEHEFERIQRIQAKKSQKMSSVLDSNDPAQISKLYGTTPHLSVISLTLLSQNSIWWT
jgi:hypothetical protein